MKKKEAKQAYARAADMLDYVEKATKRHIAETTRTIEYIKEDLEKLDKFFGFKK